MSSDSEEDFLYTNTASMLKAIKKDISFKEDKEAELSETKLKDDTIKIDDSILDITNPNKSDTCITLSDEEFPQSTSTNLIETIDNIISKKSQRGRPKKTPITDSGQRRTRSMTQSIKPAPPKKKQTRNKSTPKQTPQKNKRKSDEILTPVICLTEEENIQDSNYEVTLKVWWMSQYLQKFSIKRFDKVKVIFEFFSEKENIPENNLLFTIEKDGVIVTKDDTPDSLNINAATIIEGGHRNRKSLIFTTKTNKNEVEFKVQFKDRKRPLTITMRRNDNMEVLMHKTAAEINVDVERLKFYFDGDLIKSNLCIDDYQLEGGECIDCIKY